MKKKFNGYGIAVVAGFVVIILVLLGCSNNEMITPCLKGTQYGFFNGLWHGIIAPIDLIAMIWKDNVSVYAPNNNGAWYAFGFIIGSGGWGFFGGHTSARLNRPR
ncbi:MAG: hypothetical protein Q8867_10675 [Bacteroidota bacterium]|nr:hypothetical protein [Bacteroidota bacterium]